MKSAFIILALSFLNPVLAIARSGDDFVFREAQVFEFSNGARAHFQPATGVWFQTPDGDTVQPLHAARLEAFESTTAVPAGSGKFETVTQKGHEASFRAAESSTITFLVAEDGLWALNQEGKMELICGRSRIQTPEGSFFFEPLPETSFEHSAPFRGIRLRKSIPGNKFEIELAVFSSDLKMKSLSFDDATEIKGRGWEFVVDHGGTFHDREIIHLRLKVNGQVKEASSFVDNWSYPKAFELYEELVHAYPFAAAVQNFTHFTYQMPTATLEAWQELNASKTYYDLIREAKETGKPVRIRVTATELSRLVTYIDHLADNEVLGTLEFHPLKSAEPEELDVFLAEFQKVKQLNEKTGFMISVARPDGDSWLIYHPRGSNDDLQSSLSNCSLAF